MSLNVTKLNKMECKNHLLEFVRAEKSNGNPMVKKQCLKCGEQDSKQYKFSDFGGLEKVKLLPKFNPYLLENFYKNQQEVRKQEFAESKKEWFVGYNKYLNSEKWKSKRALVLERDKNICQACLKNKANEVHHLTYRHVMNEPLFDLVSICKPCHEKLTELERSDRDE